MSPAKVIVLIAALLTIGFTFSRDDQSSKKQPVELGTVEWSRDLDASLASAKKSGKPVFLLFQEVPG
jgi:hypothetical protein